MSTGLPGFTWDDWDFDESLADADNPGRAETVDGRGDGVAPDMIVHGAHGDFAPHFRDAAAFEFEEGHCAPAESPHEVSVVARASPVTWTLLCFGIATLMCGGALIVWSLVDDRPALWSVGTPLALIGQAIILIGLVLQLDVLGQASSANATTLAEIDRHISRLPSRSLVEHSREDVLSPSMLKDLRHRLQRLSASFDDELDVCSK